MKRWCKRPPASPETGAARQAPPGATPIGAMTRPAELQVGGNEPAGDDRPRWMAAPDRIPLTDRLPESPALQGFPTAGVGCASPVHHENGPGWAFRARRRRANGLVARKAFGSPWYVVSRLFTSRGRKASNIPGGRGRRGSSRRGAGLCRRGHRRAGGSTLSRWFDAAVATLIRVVAPLRRAGEPEEVASATCYLASDDASYITGAIMLVDGGSTAVDMLMVDYEEV